MIVRYTDPTVSIDMDEDMSTFDRVTVTLRQIDLKITKTPTVNGTMLSVALSQEETGLFAPTFPIQLQVNAWKDGKRSASAWMTSDTLDNLLDEVIE